MTDLKGWVFDIQRGVFHDGPGIRTTVYLQGCPLSCLWCHNPESQARPWMAGPEHERHKAKEVSVHEVIDEVLRDKAYYDATGGGMTLSGGEPTAQLHFCLDLLEAAKMVGLHTCLDTCGLLTQTLVDKLVPLVDLFLFDWKATGVGAHVKLTGSSQTPIRKSLEEVLLKGGKVILRCPLVPGVNDTDEHFKEIALLSHQVQGVNLMPYHTAGVHKYAELSMPYRLKNQRGANDQDVSRWMDVLACYKAERVSLG